MTWVVLSFAGRVLLSTVLLVQVWKSADYPVPLILTLLVIRIEMIQLTQELKRR